MQYSDFAIRLDSRPDGSFVVKAETPAGHGETQMRLPEGIYAEYRRLQQQAGTMRTAAPDAAGMRDAVYAADSADHTSLEALGTRLFKAMFGGSVGTRLLECCADLECDQGLRIKIYFDFLDPAERRLAQLPWEYLYWPDKERFLGRSNITPIVRYVEAPERVSAATLPGTVRVLVVISSPKGVHQLDLDQERSAIAGIFAAMPEIEYETLEDPTAAKLQQRLALKHYHVLHFMGHGAYDDGDAAGAIILEDDDGNPEPYSAKQLAGLLGDQRRSLRLVVLNACETARSGGTGGQRAPFGGVAAKLVRAGLTAVLAMQALISDRAAIAFSRQFYACLVAGKSIDYATAEGRKAIFNDQKDTIEWGTPVLFMRTGDGQIWSNVQAPDAGKSTTTTNGDEAVGIASLPAQAQSDGVDRQAVLVFAALVLVVLAVGYLALT